MCVCVRHERSGEVDGMGTSKKGQTGEHTSCAAHTYVKYPSVEVGELALCLREVVALDLGQIPITYMVVHNHQ